MLIFKEFNIFLSLIYLFTKIRVGVDCFQLLCECDGGEGGAIGRDEIVSARLRQKARKWRL